MFRVIALRSLVLAVLLAAPALARVTKIEIASTSNPAPDGYVIIKGTAYGEVDPTDPRNSIIQDIELAPRNERGMVEYSMTITIQRPPEGGNGLLFYEVVNRGFPPSQVPNMAPGVGQLIRQRGYTLVLSGWQGDLAPMPHPLQHTVSVPVASFDGQEITGRVRTLYAPAEQTFTMLLSSTFGIPLRSYAPVDLAEANAVLKRYPASSEPAQVVPRPDWAFANCAEAEFPGTPSPMHLCLKDGFDPGSFYELVYTGKNPLVLGLGFAATRDLVSFLRFQSTDDLGTPNPVAGTARAAVMQGTSQSSMFMRTFLHLGFNQNENGQMVFDGMNPHVGPLRVELNARFAMGAGVDPGQPNTLRAVSSPFTYMPLYDPVAERAGWLFERCMESNTCPKVIQTVSGSEYWLLRASLSTTDPLGRHDVSFPRNVRMYLLSSTQHNPTEVPDYGQCQQLNNHNDYQPNLRALLVALERWVLADEEPPASQIPTLRDGTLVPPDQVSTGWPDIPGVKYTGVVHGATLLDFGPDFSLEDLTGVMRQPPVVMTGNDYVILVPKVDADGNDIAGIRSSMVQAPLGTHTGWNLRREGFGEDGLCRLNGSFIPFAETNAERELTGDPRLSLEERYGDHAGYVQAVADAANQLVADRFLLPQDATVIIAQAEASDVLVGAENQHPVAVVEPTALTTAVRQVQLNGSKSFDPEGGELTFSWRVASGSAALMHGSTATPTAQLAGGAGQSTFELTVTDPKGASDTAAVTVTYVGR